MLAFLLNMQAPVCAQCNSRHIVQTEMGSLVCTVCGVEDMRPMLCANTAYSPYCVALQSGATYTRTKRFRKYLQRAAMQQSNASIPGETWKYLISRGQAFSGPADIVRYLKCGRHLKKKCYDSLPLLVTLLCPHIRVPSLTEVNKFAAMAQFRVLDDAYSKGEPFVSYLFALEYILRRIGRSDVLPFINKIQCRRRRCDYQRRLDKVYM